MFIFQLIPSYTQIIRVAGRRQAREKLVWNQFEQHLCCPQGGPQGQGSLIPMSLLTLKSTTSK